MKQNYQRKTWMSFLESTLITAIFSCCYLLSVSTSAQDFSLPSDANLLDVTQAPFNADNTGQTDATNAIQAALDAAGAGDNSGANAGTVNIIYLPKGTYLISDELQWTGSATRDIMHGENRDSVIIKLTDNNPLYASKSITKGLIYTGDFNTPTAGANRFRNGIYNLTVNTGSGNPGATGVRYFANNQGSINNVLIKSDDGEGKIGLDMGFSADNGPLLAKDIEVRGFDTGIFTAGVVNSIVLQNIKLHDQKVQAFFNDGQIVSVENLEVVGSVPGIITQGIAMFTIINSSFTGSGAASGVAAIRNTYGLFARNITTTGYLQAIDNTGAGTGILTADQNITEFSSHPVLSLFSNPETSLNLPIKQTPEIPFDDLDNWANIFDFADGDPETVTDWAPVLQKAIDSSAANITTIYFPNRIVYRFGGDVIVRGNIERIIGLESKIDRVNVNEFTFRVEAGTQPEVVIERFNSIGSRIRIEQQSSRTLIIKSFEVNRTTVAPGSGEVYLEDVVADRLIIEPGNNVWMRQYNPEFELDIPRIQNFGSNLWILGLKIEQDADIVQTAQNGSTEVLGGLVYANAADRAAKIAFDIEEGSRASFSYGEFVLRRQPFAVARESREGFTKILRASDAPPRQNGALVTLYTGYRAPATAAPVAPTDLTAVVPRYDQVLLSWTDNSSTEDGFVLQRSIGTSAFEDLDIVRADVIDFSDSLLSPSTTYTYRVKATNAAGASVFSNKVTVTTLNAPPAPAAPTNLTVQFDNGVYQFNWEDNATTETGYKIEQRALEDTAAFVTRAILGPDVSLFRDSLYLGATNYEYRVVSFFEISNSAPTNTVAFTTENAVDAIVRWAYEEETGIIAEDSGFLNRDGDLLNGANFENGSAAGVFGRGALRLDGDEHLVRYRIGNIINEKQDYPFTLSTWAKTTSTSNSTIVYFGATALSNYYFRIQINNGNVFTGVRRFGNSEDIVQGPQINDGGWHQVVAVYNTPNNFELYVDGQFIGSSDPNETNVFTTTDFRFSVGALDRLRSSDANPNDPFDGVVDESKLFYRALKPREILFEYNQALSQTPPAAPSQLSAGLADSTEVLLTWTDNSGGEAETIVQRRRSTETTFVDLDVVRKGDTTYLDQSLKGEVEYTYRIKSTRGLFESALSESVTIRTGLSNEPPRIYWQFEETEGKIATDSSGNGFNGELFETAYRFDTNSDEGIIGRGLRFDGDDRVLLRRAPEAFALESYPFSIAAWAKVATNSSGGVVHIGDKNVEDIYHNVGVSTSGRALMRVRSAGGSEQSLEAGPAINDGRWHLLSGVFRSDTVQELYVDGVLVGTLNPNAPYSTEFDRFSAGALDRRTVVSRYNGLIDEVRLYNRSLTASELLAEYSAFDQTPGVPSNLQVVFENDFDARLSWSDTTSATAAYLIERRASPSPDFVALVELPGDSLTFIDRDLSSATTYTYRVRSITKVNVSEPSGEVTIETDLDLSRGLTVYWPFEETTGTIARDASSNDLDGSLFGGQTFDANSTAGILGNALSFDGVDDQVSVDSVEIFGGLDFPFTLSTWIKTTGTNEVFVFLGDQSDDDTYWTIRTDAQGNAQLQARYNRGSQRIFGANMNDGEWHHLVGVFQNERFHELYLDGVSQGTLNATNGFYSANINRFTAGLSDDSTPNFELNGDLDDVRLYEKALNINEVLALFNQPFLPAVPSNLVATLATDSLVQLSWEADTTMLSGFVIERSTENNDFITLDSVFSSYLIYDDRTVVPSTTYGYRVRAFNGFGSSANSDEAIIRTPDFTVADTLVALYNFGADSLQSTDASQVSVASAFGDGPGLQGGTFSFKGIRGVNLTVLTKELADAISDQDYFEFTVVPDSGLKVNLSTLEFFAKRTFFGPTKVGVQTSVDGFDSTYVNNLSFFWREFSIDLSDPSFQAIDEAVTIRILPYGRNPGNWNFFRNFIIDNVRLEAGFTTGDAVPASSARVAGRSETEQQPSLSESLNESINILIYPNPVQDVLTMQLNESIGETALLVVRDLQGRVVYTERFVVVSHQHQVRLSSLESGIYYLDIIGENQSAGFKLIKE